MTENRVRVSGTREEFDSDLEELRARVERKRKAEERVRLLDELYGRSEGIDRTAVYLTVRELSEKLDCAKHIIHNAIRTGYLTARKSSNAFYRRYPDGHIRGQRARWYIHPDDAVTWAKERLKVDLQLDC